MNRFLSVLILACMLTALLICPVAAADESRSYEFDLTCNGSNQVTAAPGDILTVTLMLHRTDADASAVMYGMQDEIRYDDEFFEIIEGGSLLTTGVASSDLALRDGDRAFYLNFVSLGGGEEWNADVLVANFQVRVLGESGSSVLKNENCIVSVQDGSESFAYSARDLTVVVSTDCIVRFDPQDGSEVIEQTVSLGSRLTAPADPQRDGYRFAGWYQDYDLTIPWDFENDTVQGNMTLYAAWEADDGAIAGVDGEDSSGNYWLWWLLGLLLLGILFYLILILTRKTVEFDSCGGTPVDSVKVVWNGKIKMNQSTAKPGATFGGWYTRPVGGKRWNFSSSRVKKSMTLYAHWL